MPSGEALTSSAVRPRCAGASRPISASTSPLLVKPRSAPRRSASSEASIQSGRAVPGGVTRWRQRADPTLELVVVPAVSANPAAASTMSALAARGVEQRVDRDHRAGAGESPLGEVAVGEVGERVGAEQHEHVDAAVGGGREDALGVEAGGGGNGRPGAGEPVPALVEGDPARQQPGARPMSRAPLTFARRSAGRNRASGRAATTARGGVDEAGGRLGERRPAEHHRERPGRTAAMSAAGLVARRPPGPRRCPCRRRSWRRAPAPARPASPGRGCSEALASAS